MDEERERGSDGEKVASVVLIRELLALEDLQNQIFLDGSNPDRELRLLKEKRARKEIHRPAKSEWKRRSGWSNNPPRRPSKASPRRRHRYSRAKSTKNRQKEKRENRVEQNHHHRDLIRQERKARFHDHRDQLANQNQIQGSYIKRRTAQQIKMMIVSLDCVQKVGSDANPRSEEKIPEQFLLPLLQK